MLRWGFAGVMSGDYEIWKAEDPVAGLIDFCARKGFSSFHLGLGEARKSPERLDQLADLIQKNGMRVILGAGVPWASENADEVRQKADAAIADLQKFGARLNVTRVHAGVGGHRFQRPPAADCRTVIDRLARNCAEPARELARMGMPLCFENHGDYYVSDLVELCQRAPGVGLFLDTGNCYLIGEKPIPAAIEAAPYVVGGHFKDHFVHPDPRELKFVLQGATFGEGDVGLAEIYRILRDNTPNFESIEMMWELCPGPGENALDSMEKSWKFVRSLEA